MLRGGSRLSLIVPVLLCCIVIIWCTVACSAGIKDTIDITQVGMGARPISLGGAYTGLADDASAIFTNPAGIGLQKNMSFVSMSTQLLTCIDYQLAGFVYPTEYGNFGIGYVGVAAPAGNYTYLSGGVTVEEGAMTYANNMYIASYGIDLSDQVGEDLYAFEGQKAKVAVGVNVKYLTQSLSGAINDAPSATGFDADLGVIYSPASYLYFGAIMQDLYKGKEGESITWSTDEKESLPTTIKLGCAYRVIDTVTLLLDSDIPTGNEAKTALHAGTEWRVMPFFALRAGVDQKDEAISESRAETSLVTKYTAGIGFNFAGFGFDYAYKPDPAFNELSTHYFSLSYVGAPFEITKKVEEESSLSRYEKMSEQKNVE